MATGTQLVVHSGGVRVSLSDLERLPDPQKLGERHAPMRHDVMVRGMLEALETIGLEATKTDLCLDNSEHGAYSRRKTEYPKDRLFGTFDLAPIPGRERPDWLPEAQVSERGLAVGFRHSNDQAFAMSAVAGSRIFVCDNLAMSGEAVLFNRKHTIGNVTHRFKEILAEGCDKLAKEFTTLAEQIARLQTTGLSEEQAKAFLIDAFATSEPVMAIKYLTDVFRYWHDAGEQGETIEMVDSGERTADGAVVMVAKTIAIPDCAPRTLWGLNNAFTRVVQKLQSPASRHDNGIKVGRLFGIRDEKRQIVQVTD